MCQVLPYKLSEHTIPGLLNAIHYWILQIHSIAAPRVAELQTSQRIAVKVGAEGQREEGYRTGIEVSWCWPVFLKSDVPYITHVSTSLWFAVFWLRFSRLSWKGKRVLKLMVCTSHWPCPGIQACKARQALWVMRECSGSGKSSWQCKSSMDMFNKCITSS